MKIISLVCDTVFLFWTLFMLTYYPTNKNVILFSLGLCFLLIVNMIAILTQAGGDDFLSMYFKKRRLEQKLKIQELEKKLQ